MKDNQRKAMFAKMVKVTKFTNRYGKKKYIVWNEDTRRSLSGIRGQSKREADEIRESILDEASKTKDKKLRDLMVYG